MVSAGTRKIAIKYKDGTGVVRIKNCGNAESVRECISWLKRQGFEFIGKEAVQESTARNTRARRIKYKATN